MTAEGRGSLPVALGERSRGAIAQAQANHLALARPDGQPIMRGDLRSLLLRVDRFLLTVDDKTVDAVLDVGAPIGHAENALGVGLVLREQQRGVAVAVQVTFAQFGINRLDGRRRR